MFMMILTLKFNSNLIFYNISYFIIEEDEFCFSNTFSIHLHSSIAKYSEAQSFIDTFASTTSAILCSRHRYFLSTLTKHNSQNELTISPIISIYSKRFRHQPNYICQHNHYHTSRVDKFYDYG